MKFLLNIGKLIRKILEVFKLVSVNYRMSKLKNVKLVYRCSVSLFSNYKKFLHPLYIALNFKIINIVYVLITLVLLRKQQQQKLNNYDKRNVVELLV